MDARQKALEGAIEKHRKAAVGICEGAEMASRLLTTEERAACDKHITAIKSYGAELSAARSVEQRAGKLMDDATDTAGDGLFSAFKSAGWSPTQKAVISRDHLAKTATLVGDLEDYSPMRREGATLGFDQRYLHPVFPVQGIGADVTSVQVTRQSARTLASVSEVRRALDATSPKAETDSERELISLAVEQLAAVESDIPNVLLLQNGVRSMVDNDLRLTLLEAKDAAIVEAISDANPSSAGGAGNDLTSGIVHGAAEMAEDGYTATTVAISPADYADLQLLRGEAEMFARQDPLRGYRFAISKSIEDDAPLLIAPGQAGVRYEGPLSLASFEQNDGSTNTSLIRLEQSFAFHIERVSAIRLIEPGA